MARLLGLCWRARGRWGPLAIWKGGLGIWGGIALGTLGGLWVLRRRALGTLGGLWVLRRRRADVPRFLDAAAPGLLVAQAIGRIGNYFNQELFGGPTSLPWGLRIDPPHRPAGDEAYGTFHPTFLYELIWDLALAGALVWLGRRREIRAPGLFALYVAGYSGFRVFEELLRTDPAHHILGLRLNFFVAAILCVTGLAWFVRIQRAQTPRPGGSRGRPAALGVGWLIVALAGCGHGSPPAGAEPGPPRAAWTRSAPLSSGHEPDRRHALGPRGIWPRDRHRAASRRCG